MLTTIWRILSSLFDLSVTRVRRVPAANTFAHIEAHTKHRAYMSGLAWTWRGTAHGLYRVRYVNTFEWNKQGRYN